MILGETVIFSKLRIDHFMLKIIGPTQMRSQKVQIKIEGTLIKLCWSKIAIRSFTEIIKSSRAVLFPTENITNSYESVITGQETTLIGQIHESNCPMV